MNITKNRKIDFLIKKIIIIIKKRRKETTNERKKEKGLKEVKDSFNPSIHPSILSFFLLSLSIECSIVYLCFFAFWNILVFVLLAVS